MLTATLLATLHHWLAFGVVALLAAEWILVRPGLDAAGQRLVGRVDLAYGLGFGVLVAVGLARLWVEKGVDFYLVSGLFWAKMAVLALVTAASLPPTFAFLRWGRARRADPAFVPGAAEVGRLRAFMGAEAGLLLVVPFLAAGMARNLGG